MKGGLKGNQLFEHHDSVAYLKAIGGHEYSYGWLDTLFAIKSYSIKSRVFGTPDRHVIKSGLPEVHSLESRLDTRPGSTPRGAECSTYKHALVV